MKKLLLLFLLFSSMYAMTQTDDFEIQGHQFFTIQSVVKNEWGTKDTILKLYRINEKDSIYLLKSFKYQDQGGDCNNLFWSKEKFKIEDDRVVFTTHYYQKTGMDPIHEWRKQIYKINADGKLYLIYDKFKYYNSDEWITE